MRCSMSSCKAFHKSCIYCHGMIGYDEYDFSRTKSIRSRLGNVPAKDIYFHTKCYREENADIKKSNATIAQPVEQLICNQ